jgi:parallel beta-helix repeat protein
MSRKFKSLLILLSLISSSLILLGMPQYSVARVTYVQGDIIQDTTWTLVDSPFVISGNVTVHANATLTIEPGVEVRFGKDLDLIVLGRLQANGESMQINFTSNREQPAEGDWDTILFNGVSSSSLIGCSVAYAKNGILAQNGAVAITSCTISYCSQNGINTTNSNLSLEDNLILNCPTGIGVTGSGNVLIRNNTVMANENGIVLTGSSVSNVNLQDNSVFVNTIAGISIEAENHTNLSIIHNVISSNNYGFYISTRTSVVITNNSISNNEVGVFFNSGNHEAHYNDIYDNTAGMDISPTATANVENNYWGSQSGPYNEWLNPEGRGNPVAGDGMSLDFVFFLTYPMDYIDLPPIAELFVDKEVIWTNQPDQTVTFVATNSFDEGRVDWYYFDFGDGHNSGWTTLSTFTHVYAPPGETNETYVARATVMDDFGALASDTKNIFVDWTLSGALEVTTVVNASSSRVKENEYVSLSAIVTHLGTAVENASVGFYAVRGGTFSEVQGLTDANGYFTVLFTAPDVSELTNVKIIATASMNSPFRYADGSSSLYLSVQPLLTVQLQSNQPAVKSESSTSVTVLVTTNDQPVGNAKITLSTDSGDLSVHDGITDVNGLLTVVFYAPQTTTVINSVIAASAEALNYGDGFGQTTIRVDPKVLEVLITVEPNNMLSEATTNASVHVEYEGLPISGATVLMSSTDGNFAVSEGTTNASGNVTFLWTSPAVNGQSDIAITAEATFPGYADGSQVAVATVIPRTFNIEIDVSPSTIESGKTAAINVNITCTEDGAVVPNATVSISASEGMFLVSNEAVGVATKDTDTDGLVTFVFTGPQAENARNVVLTVNVTRLGYESLQTEKAVTIIPPVSAAEGGWPLMMMLLILIPVIVLIIVVVLIKTKVIVISSQDEE